MVVGAGTRPRGVRLPGHKVTGPRHSQNSGLGLASVGGILQGSGTVLPWPPGPASFPAHVPQGTDRECISPVPSHPASPHPCPGVR